MSTDCKKRSLEIIQLDDNEPPLKKRKFDPEAIKSIFWKHGPDFMDDCNCCYWPDHEQCISIFQSVETSPLVHKLNIPSSISKEVSEFATGDVKPCHGCSNKVVTLNWDFENGICESNKYYKSRGNYYYCIECASKTEECHRCYDGLIFLPTLKYAECSVLSCDVKVKICDNYYCLRDYFSKCSECKKDICLRYFDHGGYCKCCHSMLCPNCYDEKFSGKYKLWNCRKCDNCIPMQHKSCSAKREDILEYYDHLGEGLMDCDEVNCKEIVCIQCNDHKEKKCKCGETKFFCNGHGDDNNLKWKCFECKWKAKRKRKKRKEILK